MDPTFLILILFLGLMYLILIRPQQKRQREHREMVEKISVGDDIVTISGLHGTVAAINEDSYDLEVTDDVLLRFQKSAVARVVTPPADEPEFSTGADDEHAGER